MVPSGNFHSPVASKPIRFPAGTANQRVFAAPSDQSGPGLGLPEWTAANRSIDNTDVVLWYTFGIHHIPRPEEWPIMPVDTVSFWLKPAGFFDRNPALDVEPTPPAGCHHHS